MNTLRNLSEQYLDDFRNAVDYAEMKKKCKHPVKIQLSLIDKLGTLFRETFSELVWLKHPEYNNEYSSVMIKMLSDFRGENAMFVQSLLVEVHKLLSLTIDYGEQNIPIEIFKEKIWFYTLGEDEIFWENIIELLKKKAIETADSYPIEFYSEEIDDDWVFFTPEFSVDDYLNDCLKKFKES